MAAEPTKRDPRVNPKVGDVLMGLNGGRSERRRVTAANRSHVLYMRGRMASHVKSLAEWESWARKADVIHAAE